MSDAWHLAAGPRCTLDDALRRLADQPHLAVLADGVAGGALLSWLAQPRPVRSVSDLPRPTGRLEAVSGAGWLRPRGDIAIVQLDYEWPSGPTREPVGWCWQPAGWCWFPGRAAPPVLSARSMDAMETMQRDLGQSARTIDPVRMIDPVTGAWDAQAYRQRVVAIHDYIRAGDCYQVNLTMPFTARLEPGASVDLALWRRLCQRSPAPMAALLRTPTGSIVSHSPETFLRVVGDRAESDPIKGTIKRVAGASARQRAALHQSSKNRAELAMIVDLVRNDLGRLAQPGSVRVDREPALMDLDYAHHLYSRVRARLRSGTSHADLLAAAFPAGSITGAPKHRVMAIIRELEAGPRGPYCGTFGLLGAGADCSLSVAIRGLHVLPDGWIRFHAGGGIVIDSDPDDEWAEVHVKARRLAESLREESP